MYASYKDSRADQYKVKLVYFNGKGRVEHVRYLFAVGGRDYEDKRLAEGEWPELKPKTPFGTVPFLEADGHMIGGSVAIGRFVAKLCNLSGDNYLDQALVDAIVDVSIDVRELIITAAMAMMKSADKKFSMAKESQEKLDNFMSKLEKQLGSNQYFVANKLSYADIQFFASCEPVIEMCQQKDFLGKYPKLKALYDRVANQDKIKKYRETRPETSF